MAKSSAALPMGQNIAFFRHTFGVMLGDCMSDNLRRIRNCFELSETEAANVSVVSELQATSATSNGSNGFTIDEICVMLEAVCIECFTQSTYLSITNDVSLLSSRVVFFFHLLFFFTFVLLSCAYLYEIKAFIHSFVVLYLIPAISR